MGRKEYGYFLLMRSTLVSKVAWNLLVKITHDCSLSFVTLSLSLTFCAPSKSTLSTCFTSSSWTSLMVTLNFVKPRPYVVDLVERFFKEAIKKFSYCALRKRWTIGKEKLERRVCKVRFYYSLHFIYLFILANKLLKLCCYAF